MTEITGTSWIGYQRGGTGGQTARATNPATGTPLPELFYQASPEETDRACALAGAAFGPYSRLPGSKRAGLLDAAADRLESDADAIVPRYVAETGLPEGRARSELGRTVGQLRMFAQLVRDGHWVNARIETALPDRKPVPKPDLRTQLEPLGPVAVFCASNFPLAFSVAGGDTASALAAGCPVIVSAHSAHPGTAELVAGCLATTAREQGLPEGTFSMLQGPGRVVGIQILKHPAVKAAGFTGSRSGGHALMQVAAARPEPIPVYAEMSSINPVVMLPGCLSEPASATLAQGLAASVTLGVGQFCTNPGLVFLPTGPDADGFVEALIQALGTTQPGVMLTSGIAAAYQKITADRECVAGVSLLHRAPSNAPCTGAPTVFETDTGTFSKTPDLQVEAFGPSTILVRYDTESDLVTALNTLEGQLTGTLHAGKSDLPLSENLRHTLRQKVGRLILNQFPTGVEVCHAMIHGGPHPATSDGRSTSVGTLAIERFCRPVCYQNFPSGELPDALKDENPLGLWRLVNGNLQRGGL